AGKFRIDLLVEAPEEFNGLDVFSPALAIRYPVTFAASIVQIQHGGHGIHAKPFQMVLDQPEQGVADQKAADLISSVIEHKRIPVGVLSFSRIGVLVKMRSVEIAEASLVFRKVRGDPVQNHADSMLVKIVHEKHEVGRRAEAAGGSEVTGGLIAPGTVEGVLHDGE